MKRSASTRLKGVVVAVVAGGILWSCTHDQPTAPSGRTPSTNGGIDPTSIVTVLSCNADVASRRVACGKLGENALDAPAPADGTGEKANLIIGGQGVYVSIQTTNAEYNGGTGAFTFDATIRNLIPQPLGTADTIPPTLDPHPNGVRIFIAGGPTVTEGSGEITVVADGVDAFTGANQPYYQYNTVLEQFEVSAPRTWLMNMPSTVERFTFVLLVSAAVPRPDGYVDVLVSNSSATPPTDRQLTWFVRNANGTLAADQTITTWASSDTTRATVNSGGLVNPLRAGQTIITALTSDGRVGYMTLTVKSIRRNWTGAVSTDWHTGGNWSPDNVVPVESDTAVIPDDQPRYPVLLQNTMIGGVEMADTNVGGTIPSISLGAFDLTASGSVFTVSSLAQTSAIEGPGRVILTGISQTVRGFFPAVRVTGRYSLEGNVSVRGSRLEVALGRLQNTGFRIQVTP